MALDCGGIIVLAGKGAEDYLDIRGKKIDYSDKMLVQKVLSEEEFIV
jgi:UDP-N-acetylmuramyl tripeptide synthase